MVCSSCQCCKITPSNISSHPSGSCSHAAINVKLAGACVLSCHQFKPVIMSSCHSIGLVCCACNQSLWSCNAVSQCFFDSAAWHLKTCVLVSTGFWQHGHCLHVCNFHHCMLTPYGKNYTANLVTHC